MTTAARNIDVNAIRQDKALLDRVIREAGGELRGGSCRCVSPEHEDTRASAGTYQKNGAWRYRCHGCGIDEDAIGLKMLVDGIDFKTACEALGAYNGNGSAHKGNGHAKANGTTKPTDWAPTMARFRSQMTEQALHDLAGTLGLPVESIRVAGIGWAGNAYPDGAFAFGEVDGTGELIGVSLRSPDGTKRSMKGGHRGLFRIEGETFAGPVLVPEGASDVIACHAMHVNAVGRPGAKGGVEYLAVALKNADPIIVGENDGKPDGSWPGRDGAKHTAKRLANAWKRPVRWALPPTGHKDIRAFYVAKSAAAIDAETAGRELLVYLVENAVTVQPDDATDETRDGDTPLILIATDEYRVVQETIDALAADPSLYQRGMLVRVVRDNGPEDGIVRSSGSPTIQATPAANLRERMTQYARFIRLDNEKPLPAHPPAWLVSAVHARGEWPGIRQLTGISDTPVLRPDGSIHQTAGYDQRTGVLYEPSESFPAIPEDIARADVEGAVNLLLDVVCDFPFEAPEHRAAWVAALLTPFARFAFSGPAPLFLHDANIRGSGKTLLAKAIGRIVLGRDMPVSAYNHDVDEMRKRITAVAIAGDRVLLLDNIAGAFGNDALDRALTATRWKDRILGRSEEIDLPLLVTWLATGNNVQVAADSTRRIIHIRLDYLGEHPEERRGFRHPDLLRWIGEHRPRLLAAALTILAGHVRDGRAVAELTPFGSFEGWSTVVREAVVRAGLPDPCLTRTKLMESADTTADAIEELLAAWAAYPGGDDGLILSDLLHVLYPPDRNSWPPDAASVAMRAALENIVGCPPGKAPTPRQVGNRLKSHRRRVIGRRYIDTAKTSGDGAVWKVIDTETAA